MSVSPSTRRRLCATTITMALLVPAVGVAQARDVFPDATASTAKVSSQVTKKTGSKSASVRNNERYAKAGPMWVQRPVLVRKKGKAVIEAKVSARAYAQGKSKKTKTDQIALDVALVRKGNSTKGFIPQGQKSFGRVVAQKVSKNGVVSFSVPVSRKVAKALRAPSAGDRMAVTVTHAKDTFPGGRREFQQVLTGRFVTQNLSAKAQRKMHRKNVVRQRQHERGVTPKRSGSSLSNLNEAYTTAFYVYNNTPFEQAVSFNPNIACMLVVDDLINGGTAKLAPLDGTVQFILDSEASQNIWQWTGTKTGNPPSGPGTYVDSLAQDGREALNTTDELAGVAETYSEEGLLAGGLTIGLTFGIEALVDWIDSNNECNNFGQYWGVTATATSVGSIAAGTVPAWPSRWASGEFDTPGEGYTTYQLGDTANLPSSLPTDASDQQALQALLDNAVGQQTQVTYFNNGGSAAPMSNNGGNGSSNYAQGLVQYMYPNGPSCQSNDCNSTAAAIQLNYIVDGYTGAVGPTLDNLPTAAVTGTTDATTGENVTAITCTVDGRGTFTNPFGGGQGSPSPLPEVALNSLGAAANVEQAKFVVSFYALDSAGTYLYNKNTTSVSTFPGPIDDGQATSYSPALQATDNAVQVLDMSQADPTVSAQLNLAPSDIANLIDPTTGDAATPASYGCAVIPVVQWQNMDVTGGTWGGNWPWPQVQTGGPLSSPYDNAFNWVNPVTNLNHTWTGDSYVSAPQSSQGTAGVPTSVSPAQGPVTGDTNVTISGSNFAANSTVTIGGQPCTSPVVVDSDTITCVTGAVNAADVRGDVVVTGPTGISGSNKGLFTFTSLVSGVSPNTGSMAGGTSITISGTGFGRDSTVMLGGKSCKNPVVVSTTQITCTTPGVSQPGAVGVAITNPRPLSTSTLPSGFTYQ